MGVPDWHVHISRFVSIEFEFQDLICAYTPYSWINASPFITMKRSILRVWK